MRVELSTSKDPSTIKAIAKTDDDRTEMKTTIQ